VEHLKRASVGQALALLPNIRPGWESMPWINPQTYLEYLLHMPVKDLEQ